MCFVWIPEQTAIISLYNINWLVCITETECVYCAVRTETLNVIHASFPLSFRDFSLHFGNNDYRLRSTGSCSIVDGYRRFGRRVSSNLRSRKGTNVWTEQLLPDVGASLPDSTSVVLSSYLKTLCHFSKILRIEWGAIFVCVCVCVCVCSICTVQCIPGATWLAGRMRLSRRSCSAGILRVKSNIQVPFVHTWPWSWMAFWKMCYRKTANLDCDWLLLMKKPLTRQNICFLNTWLRSQKSLNCGAGSSSGWPPLQHTAHVRTLQQVRRRHCTARQTGGVVFRLGIASFCLWRPRQGGICGRQCCILAEFSLSTSSLRDQIHSDFCLFNLPSWKWIVAPLQTVAPNPQNKIDYHTFVL